MATSLVKFEQVTVGSTAVSLTPPTTAFSYAVLQVSNGNIRVRMDGTAPTTSVGKIWEQYREERIDWVADIVKFQAIRDGSTDATLEVEYFLTL